MPSGRKKGGRYDDYIFRTDSDWYLHCCPCKFVLYNLQGKKIAATTRNSDGEPFSVFNITYLMTRNKKFS